MTREFIKICLPSVHVSTPRFWLFWTDLRFSEFKIKDDSANVTRQQVRDFHLQ
jgi:hypothetical protein